MSKALEYYNRSLPLRRTAGDRRGEANTLGSIGVALHSLGERQKALEYLQQALTLRAEWGPTTAGTVLTTSDSWRGVWAQLRPQYANPRALVDPRVRRALAHSVNKQALNDASFEGQGVMTDAPFIAAGVAYYPEVDRAIAKYPYNPRAAEQLMGEKVTVALR